MQPYGTHVVWYIHINVVWYGISPMNVVGHAPTMPPNIQKNPHAYADAPWRVPYPTTFINANCDNNKSDS